MAAPELKEVQWRHFWGSHENRPFTPVHLYDPETGYVSGCFRKTICGKQFHVEDRENYEPMGRKCKSCKRIAALREAKVAVA